MFAACGDLWGRWGSALYEISRYSLAPWGVIRRPPRCFTPYSCILTKNLFISLSAFRAYTEAYTAAAGKG